ncbi:MAG: homoserine O-acetyltransferase [Nitrospirota bacterium]|nr:homoserine O-acetyltransferase [Nitrospirota bacterium]
MNVATKPDSVGVVRTLSYEIGQERLPFRLALGGEIQNVTIAYETYGKLSAAKDNVILIVHALSGDAHVAGYHTAHDKRPGWWDFVVGPKKAIDTDRYFVVCSNILGGCSGSTGPSSLNPDTGKPYGILFPMITVKDMVFAQRLLLEHLGVKQVLSVIGGSMGGMQALLWGVYFHDFVRSIVPCATTGRLSPQNIAFDEVGRFAIMADPNWRGGDYYGHKPPARGLATARMIAHITYLSKASMLEKFGRQPSIQMGKSWFEPSFSVEDYLHHQGTTFVERFDANSYLYITKAMDIFDFFQEWEEAPQYDWSKGPKVLIPAFSSDWLFPPEDSKALVKAFKRRGADISFIEVNSDYGHDAFLLEKSQLSPIIRDFLRYVQEEEQ